MGRSTKLTEQEAWELVILPRLQGGLFLQAFYAEDTAQRFRDDSVFRQTYLEHAHRKFLEGYREHDGDAWEHRHSVSWWIRQLRMELRDGAHYCAGALWSANVGPGEWVVGEKDTGDQPQQ